MTYRLFAVRHRTCAQGFDAMKSSGATDVSAGAIRSASVQRKPQATSCVCRQLPPQPEPGCDAETGEGPPVVVVVVGIVARVIPEAVVVVDFGVSEMSCEGVMDTS